MKKAAMVFLWAMTLGVGCWCGDDPCDRGGRGDDRGPRWGRHHDRDDEREVCEEDGGPGGGGSPAGDAGAGNTGAADAGAGSAGAGDAGVGDAAPDSCVHPLR